MTPRPYRMQRRREGADENRARIIAAARDLLASPQGSPRFSIEAVARRAGVARMTVYHQFGSLRGLLEALLDSLASAGGMQHLAEAFRQSDAWEAIDRFIAVFTQFWESDRLVIRALGAFTSLDPDFAAVLAERSGWRRKGARALVDRLVKQTGRPERKEIRDAEDLLVMLTGFATYDALAGAKRRPDQVTALLQRLARRGLG
jgi:AcrR family transcriptional regulator